MMHVVLGDGEMTRRELTKTLDDLVVQARDLPDDDEFWFLIQGKAEPTATDKAMLEWFEAQDTWFAVITDDKKAMDAGYKGAQEVHEVKRLAPKVVSLMEEKPGEGEGAALYGLFVNNDADVPEDGWLNDVMAAVVEGGFKIFSMNDGLVELGLPGDGEAEPEEEEEAEPDNVVEMTTKSKRLAPSEPETEEPADDDLENLTSEQLRALGLERGMDFPPRTRMTTMIKALRGEGIEAEVEEIEVPEPDDEYIEPEDDGGGNETHAQALLIVVYNGMVVSRAVSLEEARDLVSL